MIDQRELFRWLNSARDWNELLERSGAFADLVGNGALRVITSDGVIVGLETTETGNAMMPPPLPFTIA